MKTEFLKFRVSIGAAWRQAASNRLWVALFAILSLTPASMVGQTYKGGLAGTVVDASGAAIPDALVKATNNATGLARSQTTPQAGDFNFPDLPLGVYTVSVIKTGFQPFSHEIEVAVGMISSLAVTLGVASQTQ